MTDMARPITELRDKWKGADVCVVASGASMDAVPPDFFSKRHTIGVNRVYGKYDCDYAVMKEREAYREGRHTNVVTKHLSGNTQWGHFEVINPTQPYYVADHSHNSGPPDLSVIGEGDKLVTSDSTTTTALHLAAYMGAAVVWVFGHDCAPLEGRLNYLGYYPPGHANRTWYEGWLERLAEQSRLVQQECTKRYGTLYYTVSPLVGLHGGLKCE